MTATTTAQTDRYTPSATRKPEIIVPGTGRLVQDAQPFTNITTVTYADRQVCQSRRVHGRTQAAVIRETYTPARTAAWGDLVHARYDRTPFCADCAREYAFKA